MEASQKNAKNPQALNTIYMVQTKLEVNWGVLKDYI